ncbi:MAG: TonB-dependent receptor, partial [Bacteroidota bacterium]
EVRSEESSNTSSIRYSKSGMLGDKLDLKLFGIYNRLNSLNIDTSSNRYNWLGEITRVANDNSAELFTNKTLFDFEQETFIYRANLKYEFLEEQFISGNYLGFHVTRQGENRLGIAEEEPFRSPNTLNKNIVGLSYDGNFFNNKLNLNIAGKFYDFRMFTRNAKRLRDFSVVIEDLVTDQNRIGYYAAARYFIQPEFFVKASYERGFRLPEPVEIFGNGLDIYANAELQPESTHNYNLGFNYGRTLGKGKFKSEVNFFSRDVSNYTFRTAFVRGSIFQNILAVIIYGYDVEVAYNWKNKLMVDANISRQYVLNNEEFLVDSNRENKVYRDQLPNTPYLFWNFGASYDLLKEERPFKLLLNYSLNYVHEFYLGYPSIALGAEKNTIPTQVLQNLGATISSKDNRYSFSLEARNIFNALAFDNFNIQKPGRAIYAKFRYYLN